MPTSNYENSLYEFHRAFGHTVDEPNPPIELAFLRARLISEEADEAVASIRNWMFERSFDRDTIDAKKNVAKELADLLYVVFGAAVTFGIPIQEVFNRVHTSNMSKLGEDGKPIYREDGKVLKGPNYKEPDLYGLF